MFLKATIRLAVKYLELVPSIIPSLQEGFKYPELFLVDENVAIAMCFNEIMLLL